MGKIRHFDTRSDMAAAMERIVSREVKHYKTDWTDYDRPAILDEQRTKTGESFIWITRECGTHLFPATSADSIRAVLECWENRCNVRFITMGPKCCEISKIDAARELQLCRSACRRSA